MEGVMSQSSRTQVFSCPECPYAFTSQVFFHKHLKMNHDHLYCQMLKNGQIPSLSHINTYCEMLRNGQILPVPSRSRQKITSYTITSQEPGGADEQRIYSCQPLTNILTQPREVKRHQTTYTDNKTHICVLCDKRFNQLDGLKTHQCVRPAAKPFHCKQCNRSFRRLGMFQRHKHTAEKPFRCDRCKKSFTEVAGLRRHRHRL